VPGTERQYVRFHQAPTHQVEASFALAKKSRSVFSYAFAASAGAKLTGMGKIFAAGISIYSSNNDFTILALFLASLRGTQRSSPQNTKVLPLYFVFK